MKYRDCVEAPQAVDDTAEEPAADTLCFTEVNINPVTGLANDYLNHFNEAIMLLEMLSSCPEFRADLLSWRPMSYREHFAASAFRGRDAAIAAYENADPQARNRLDALAAAMTAELEATRAALGADMPHETAGALAEETARSLKPLVARAGAVINGRSHVHDGQAPQAAVDSLMEG